MKPSIAVIILTFNEEKNIEKCLQSVAGWAQEIFVIDSYSTDRTIEIAKKFGVIIAEHKFENQALQFNWGLDTLPIQSDWILKLDADEEISPELRDEIIHTLPQTKESVSGFYMKRKVYFMNKWIRFGGYYPAWFLRLWRKGKGRSEERKMDEHIVVTEGTVENFKCDFIDDNRNGLREWMKKHKKYASREAQEVRVGNYGLSRKMQFYYTLPPFIRPIFLFVYRYFFRLGFLDGFPGLIFHFLQGLWYRFLIDAKIYGFSKI